MKIDIDKKHLINELAWCLDLVYPGQVNGKGKIVNFRVGLKNRRMMAKGIADLLQVYSDEDCSCVYPNNQPDIICDNCKRKPMESK